jgi:hypothetical protein
VTPALERHYRLLLRAYPASWRAERAAEMLGTLADRARPGQRLPAPAEVAGLLAGALRARALEAGGRNAAGTVLDGIYLGVVLMHLLATTAMLTLFLGPAHPAPTRIGLVNVVEIALTPLAVVALLRGWLLPAVAVVAAQRLAPALITGGPVLDDGLADAAVFWLDQAYPAVVLAGLGLVVHLRWTTWRPRRLSAWLLAAPGVLLAMTLAGDLALASGIEALIALHGRLALALAAAFVTGVLVTALVDPRVVAAAAVWAVALAASLPGASPDANRLPLYAAVVISLLIVSFLMTRRLTRL